MALFHGETIEPYVLLGVEKTSTTEQIKKAYHKKALLVHPDRHLDVTKRQEATVQFQKLGFAYTTLSDSRKREIYDKTGNILDEELNNSTLEDWAQLWRELFPPLTPEAIKQFEREYKNSLDEREDLKRGYLKHKGNMDMVIAEVYLYTTEDEERYRSILQDMIDKKEIKSYTQFTQETQKKRTSRKRQYEGEAAEAEQMAQQLGLKGSSKVDVNMDVDSSLKALIQTKGHQRFNHLLTNLETKYGGKSKGKRH